MDRCPRMIQSLFILEDRGHRITLGQVPRDDTIPLQHHHSPFRGRSFRTTPSLSRKCSNFTRDRGFVNTSATCSSILTYWSFMAPFYVLRFIMEHWVLCLFIQLWLSHRITVVSSSRLNNPINSFRSHMDSQLAEKAAIYFASVTLRETLDCFLLNHEFIAYPRL